ncbi:hypothetical protein [Actinokineospora sp.]|uniref:hypothetical protein n=1 Tax=Actinokineospora sp. TaxID=1872133 RepID=UPI004037B9A5
MSTLLDKVNASEVLAAIPLRTEGVTPAGSAAPVLATPATVVGFAAGVAVVSGVAGAFMVGYNMGQAAGSTRPKLSPQ